MRLCVSLLCWSIIAACGRRLLTNLGVSLQFEKLSVNSTTLETANTSHREGDFAPPSVDSSSSSETQNAIVLDGPNSLVQTSSMVDPETLKFSALRHPLACLRSARKLEMLKDPKVWALVVGSNVLTHSARNLVRKILRRKRRIHEGSTTKQNKKSKATTTTTKLEETSTTKRPEKDRGRGSRGSTTAELEDTSEGDGFTREKMISWICCSVAILICLLALCYKLCDHPIVFFFDGRCCCKCWLIFDD